MTAVCPIRPSRAGHSVAVLVLVALVSVAMVWDGHEAAAQGAAGPFGIGSPEAGAYGSGSGFLGWIAAQQSAAYLGLKAALKAFRSDPAAGWWLVALSAGYGVFHAAGPGHGKAVIASYVIANRQTLRRGIVLSFISALFQGAAAIGFVAVARYVFNVTAVQMSNATERLELTSALMICALGLWLVATKVLRIGSRPVEVPSGPDGDRLFGAAHVHDANCRHITLQSFSTAFAGGAAVGAPAVFACSECGSSHLPDPETLAGDFDLRKALSAIVAVGIRPCSGAIIVLVFAFSQQLYTAGILSVLAMSLGTGITVAVLASAAVFLRDRAVRLAGEGSVWGGRIVRMAEIAAACAVLVMGGLLLAATLLGTGSGG